MNKKVLALALLCTACGSKQKDDTTSQAVYDDIPEAEVSVFEEEIKDVDVPRFALLTQKKLPKAVDLKADISKCPLQELVLLRNYVYAIHGCYFIEAEIERFFEERTDWYYPMVERMCEEENTVLDYKHTRLSKEEQDFVDRIDIRISELSKEATLPSGLTHPSAIKTLWQFTDLSPQFLGHLAAHNFVITPTQCEQLFNVYEENDYRQVGSFVTTDLLLQLYHMFFVYAQKSLEKDVLSDKLTRLCALLAVDAGKEDSDEARFAAAYLHIPVFLQAGEMAEDYEYRPAGFEEEFAAELANIYAERTEMSPLLQWDVYFPYDQFKPRGYYDRQDWSRQYFRAMQWLQLAGLNYNNDRQLSCAIYIARLLNKNEEAKRLYQEIDSIISFLMGESDNVSLLDLASFLEKADNVENLDNFENLENVREFIVSSPRNRIHSKLPNPADSTLMFMPARYVPDNEVLMAMTDEALNANRSFPRGLDVFSAFGVKQAEWIQRDYYHDPREWSKWESNLYGLQKNRKQWAKDNADKTVYNKWLSTLFTLSQSRGEGVFGTQAWTLKNINTSLASWAELKHDAVLYAEQPMLAECGGGGCLPTPYVKGYVEPNLAFWQALEELCTLTRDKLKAAGAYTDDLSSKLSRIHDLTAFCRKATEKELRGELLSEDEHWRITRIGSSVEWLTLSLIQPEVDLSFWNDVQGADRSIACVADIFTRNITDCRKCGILHVATGLADAIYVMVRMGDFTYLTRGATLSYREFVEPLGSRLTDEEWQKRLLRQPRYGEPSWMQHIKLTAQPKVDESIFYSSGC